MELFVRSPAASIDRFTEKLLIGMAITCAGKLIGCDRALAEVLGYSFEEILYQDVSSYVSPDQANSLMERIRQHDTSWYNLDLKTKSGEIIPAIVIPEEMIFEGRVVRTAVLLHRGPIEDTESELLNGLRNAIATLSKAIESRDPYTAGHQSRVSFLATMIGRELSLQTTSIQNIELAASVHDIGKISIPSELLVKPGALTEGEWIIMKSHPIVGEEIFSRISCSSDLRYMIRSHHERLDGTGYPDGLSGDQLSIEVRILGVADALDAIAGVRPYHAPRTMEDAFEIVEGCGAAYDRDVLSATRSLYNQGKLSDRVYTGFVENDVPT